MTHTLGTNSQSVFLEDLSSEGSLGLTNTSFKVRRLSWFDSFVPKSTSKAVNKLLYTKMVLFFGGGCLAGKNDIIASQIAL